MNKKRLALISLLIALVTVFAVAFTACGGKSKAKISLDPTTLSVAVGASGQIKATADENPTWTVEDNSIATIAALGKICSVKGVKEGSTKVIAKVGENSAECTVTVTKNDTETVVIKNAAGEEITTLPLEAGNSATLTATASKGSQITWTTSDAKIVTVVNGTVTAGNFNGEATITAKVSESIKAEVKVTVTGGAVYYTLANTGEDGAAQTKDTWTYWAAEWVIVDEAYCAGDAVTIKFSNNDSDSPTYFYATQMFYCKSDLESGSEYKLTFDADVDATAGGRVTLNGNIINLEKGKHSYTTYYNETGKSIGLQFGVNGIGMEIIDATVTFSNLQWGEAGAHEKLEAPSFTYNDSTKVITITDTNAKGSVGSYTLNFYDGDNVIGNTIVTNGGVVDLSTIPNGTHTAKLVANGANVHFEASDPSANGVQITVANAKTQITNGEEHDAYINPGAWYEWHDQGWNGAHVTVKDAYIDSQGAIHFDIANTSGNQQNQAAHLYKHDASLTPGNLYILTMKLNSSVACTIDVCDTNVDLVVGDNNVSVPFTHPVENPAWNGLAKGATIRIYFNNDGTFVLSNISVDEAQATQLTAPSFSISDEKVITITDTNDAANVGKYELGFFQGDDLKTTVTVVSGEAVDLSNVAAGEYTVKLRAVGASALYTTSEWSSDSATLTSSNTNVPIEYSEEKSTFTGWKYWDSKEAADWNQYTAGKCTECYMDSNGKITMTCTIEGTGANWAVQMFYKHATDADGYNVSLTIKSSVDTTITVCGQQIELTANVEKPISDISNYKSKQGSAIDIQFGLTGGTFEISGVDVTPVVAE